MNIIASNSPTSYAASGLPPGLSVNTTSGLISGTPTTTGTYVVIIQASNGGGSGSASLALTVTSSGGGSTTITTTNTGSGNSATINPCGLGGGTAMLLAALLAGFVRLRQRCRNP